MIATVSSQSRANAPQALRNRSGLLAGCGLLVPLLALPCHAGLHELLEQLVRFGR